jgi:hypothetical protein
MATYTSALSLYKAQLARFQRMGADVRSMHADIARHSYEDARRLTEGGNGPQFGARRRWLARNRPFARNMARVNIKAFRGPGRVQRLPIGVITAQLYSGWSLTRIQSQRGQEFHLRNSAPHARYILFDAGTRKMLGRGFQAEIRRRWMARNKALLDTIRIRQAR